MASDGCGFLLDGGFSSSELSFNLLIDGVALVGLTAAAFFPIAIAIAIEITRYGLYELGRIFNRTVPLTRSEQRRYISWRLRLSHY